MNIKVIFTLIATIIWFGGGWWYYTCKIKGFCGDDGGKTSVATSNEQTNNSSKSEESKYPLAFQWGDANPITGPDFEAYRQALLADTLGGKNLTITGRYFAGEGNSQLGLQRAQKLRLMLANVFDTNRIFINQALAESENHGEGSIFESVSFAWNKPEKSIIERTGNRLTVYFPYKSTQKIDDPEIDQIFEELVNEIRDKKLSVSLVGHTDNIGSDDYNQKLGTQRANAIKELLVKSGLQAEKITTSSQGRKQPIGDNSSESGRKKNRRVDITIQ